MSAYGLSYAPAPSNGRLFSTPTQLPIVFLAMLVSTVPVSVFGTYFAMGISPFWTPDQYSEGRLFLYRH